MIAPEASVLKSDGEVSYLWSCHRCGQGFVTESRLAQPGVAHVTLVALDLSGIPSCSSKPEGPRHKPPANNGAPVEAALLG